MLPPPYFEQVDQQAEQGKDGVHGDDPWMVIALPSPPIIAVTDADFSRWYAVRMVRFARSPPPVSWQKGTRSLVELDSARPGRRPLDRPEGRLSELADLAIDP
jgi:hypothetical protein